MPSTRFRVSGASITYNELPGTSIGEGIRMLGQGLASKRKSDIAKDAGRVQAEETAAEEQYLADQMSIALGGTEASGHDEGMQKFFGTPRKFWGDALKDQQTLRAASDQLKVQERTVARIAKIEDPSVKERLAALIVRRDEGQNIDADLAKLDKIATTWGQRQRNGMLALQEAQMWMEVQMTPGPNGVPGKINMLMPDKVEEYQRALEFDAENGGEPMSEKEHDTFQKEILRLKNDPELLQWMTEQEQAQFRAELQAAIYADNPEMPAQYNQRPYADVQAEREQEEFGGAAAGGASVEPPSMEATQTPTPEPTGPPPELVSALKATPRGEGEGVSWAKFGSNSEGFKPDSVSGASQAVSRGKANQKKAREKLSAYVLSEVEGAGGMNSVSGRMKIDEILFSLGFTEMAEVNKAREFIVGQFIKANK